jgi:PAS domain S-box-containing protein
MESTCYNCKVLSGHLETAEKLYESILQIDKMQNATMNEILDYALDTGISITSSKFGYIFFYNEDTQLLTNYSWSKDVMPVCEVMEPQMVYELHKSGLWGEAIRQNKSIITNNYTVENPYKRGMPEGHVSLTRHMNVPLQVNDKIVALIGVANKETDYDSGDEKYLQLLMREVRKKILHFDMEKRLADSEQQLRSTFEQAAVGIVHTSLDGKFTKVNKKVCDIIGYTPEEMLNLTFQSITHPEDLHKDLNNVKQLLAGQIENFSREKRYIKKNGEIIWINLTASIMQNLAGEPEQFIGVIEDITERKRNEVELKEYRERLEYLVEMRITQLSDSEEQQRAQYKSIPIPTYTWKKFQDDFILVDYNDAADKVSQGRVKSRIGNKVSQMYRDKPMVQFFMNHCFSMGHAVEMEMNRWDKRLEEFRDFEITYAVVPPDRVLMHVDDVTEKKRAVEEVRLFFNTTLDMLCIAGFDGYFKQISPTWSQMLGWTSEELRGKPFIQFIHKEDRKKTIRAAKLLMQGKDVIGFENRFFCKDGSYKWLDWNSRAIVERKVIIAAARDSTEWKRVTSELVEARKAAELANDAKSMFLANISHEIRTPLNVVIGFSELLLSQLSDKKHKSYLESISAAGAGLLTIINDILDMSKMEAGKMQLEFAMINPRVLLQEIVLIFKHKIQKKKIQLILEVAEDLPEALLLDEVRLRQVLLNLVANAVKFTEKGFIKLSMLTINHPIIEHKMINLILKVEDTGIGIPLDDQADIFESFRQQSGQSNRKYGGTGLGLSITKNLVELMNGKVTVSSTEGQGSVFTVELKNVEVAQELLQQRDNIFELQSEFFDKTTVYVVGENGSIPWCNKKEEKEFALETFDISSELKHVIEEKVLSIIPKRTSVVKITNARNIAMIMLQIGQDYKNQQIVLLGEDLLQATQSFDINKIKEILKAIEELLKPI